jgi:hypothetical protein
MKKKRTKSDPLIAQARVDRRVLSVVSFADSDDAKTYWKRQSINARLRHVELLRRINYGSAATERLQRVLEVVRPKRG